MSNDIDETAAGGRKNPDNRIVDATDILTGGDALDLVNVDSGDRAKTYLIDLDLIAAAYSGGLTLGQLNFFGNSGAEGTDGRETLDLLKEIEATGDDTRDPGTFIGDGGSRQRLELFADDGSGGAVAADDLIALILAAIAGEADLDFFETDTGFDIQIGGRWSTDILRFEGATAQQLAEDLLPPVNTPPVALNPVIELLEDQTFSNSDIFIPLLASDADSELTPLSFTFLSASFNGDAVDVRDAGFTSTRGPNTRTELYQQLAEGELAVVEVTYEVTDGEFTSTGVATLNVTGINDEPEAVDDTITLTAGESLSDVLSLLLANDSDVDGDDLSVLPDGFDFSDTNPELLGVEIIFDGTAFTTFEIVAMDGVSGTTSFTYEVSDGNGGTDTATVTVEIEGSVEIPDPVLVTAFDVGSYNFLDDGSGGVVPLPFAGVLSGGESNGYFAFDIPEFDNELESVTISLSIGTFNASSGTVLLYDVTSATDLVTDGNFDELIFEDLQSGDLYATTDYSNDPFDPVLVELELSAAALEDIEAASGGQFSIGMARADDGEMEIVAIQDDLEGPFFPTIELTFSDQLL